MGKPKGGHVPHSLKTLRSFIELKRRVQQQGYEYAKSVNQLSLEKKKNAVNVKQGRLKVKKARNDSTKEEMEGLRRQLISMDRIVVSCTKEMEEMVNLKNEHQWPGSVIIFAHTKRSAIAEIKRTARKNGITHVQG